MTIRTLLRSTLFVVSWLMLYLHPTLNAATLHGTVYIGSVGAPGVTILLTNDRDLALTAVSNFAGGFEFRVPPDDYVLHAQLQPYDETRTVCIINEDERYDFEMQFPYEPTDSITAVAPIGSVPVIPLHPKGWKLICPDLIVYDPQGRPLSDIRFQAHNCAACPIIITDHDGKAPFYDLRWGKVDVWGNGVARQTLRLEGAERDVLYHPAMNCW